MKIKKTIIILVASIVTICLAAPSAWAGNVQRNRWEGVAIGLGAAVLGHALFGSLYRQPEPAVVYRPPSPPLHEPYQHRESRGYWEIRKKWIPPVYEQVWNPSHYNSRGHWIEGHWMKIEREPGYWIEERVWVSNQRHDRQHYYK